MEKLNTILQDAVPSGEDATGKVLGAAFIVTNKDGTQDELVLTVRCAEAKNPRHHFPPPIVFSCFANLFFKTQIFCILVLPDASDSTMHRRPFRRIPLPGSPP